MRSISIRKSLTILMNEAIKKAYPLDDQTKVEINTNHSEIDNYDYLTYAPKNLYDKYKMRNYTKSYHFYGLFDYKQVADDLRIQIPRNDIISKTEASANGFIKITIDDKYLINQLKNTNTKSIDQKISKNKSIKRIIFGPLINTENGLDYDYFRALNLTEKLFKMYTVFSKNEKILAYIPIKGDIVHRLNFSKYFPLLENFPDLSSFSNSKKDTVINNYSNKFEDLKLLTYFIQKILNDELGQDDQILQNNYMYELSLISNYMSENIMNKYTQIIHDELGNSKIQIKNYYFGQLLLPKKIFMEMDEFKPKYITSNEITSLSFNEIENIINHIKPEFEKYLKANHIDFIYELCNPADKAINYLNKYDNVSSILIDLIKLYELNHKSIKTYILSPSIILEFFQKEVLLFLKTFKLMKDIYTKINYKNDIDDGYELDGISRHLALKIIQINELFEDIESKREIKLMYDFLKDFSKIWWNIFQHQRFENIKNQKFILEISLYVFEKMLSVLFINTYN